MEFSSVFLEAAFSAVDAAGQGARAAETGRLAQQASGGQDGAEERLPDLQTSQSTLSPPQQLSPLAQPFRTPTHDLIGGLDFFDLDFADGNLDLNFSLSTPDEDGAGSMLVAPSSELHHHVSPKHDTRDAYCELPATFPQRPPDMEVATNNATDAPVLPMPDAPAADLTAHNTANGNSLSNGLALGEPIDFPQPAAMNGLDMNLGMGMGMAPPDFTAMDFPPPMASDERLTAFARLRFDDGSYYMHTYQIILGRNIELARRDMRRIARVDQLQAEGHSQAAEALLDGSAAKKKKKRAARSVISERGGIVNAPISSMPLAYQQRRHSNASQSLSSGSHPTGESGEEKPVERAPQDMLMQAFPEVPAQFDGHVPEDPHDCPLVPIHPQHVTARTGTHGPKGISRQHAKIFFDFDQGHFCIEVLGNNGLHHESEYKHRGEVVPLSHGDRLVIGAVNLQFYLPDVALTEEQRQQESGSRPMSFQFENGHGELESDELISSESEGEISINPKHVYHVPMDSELESDDPMEEDDDMDDYEEPVPRPRKKPAPKLKLKLPAPAAPPARKEHKKAHKRKYRDESPDDIPLKKLKKHKEMNKEPVKEAKAAKEPKVSKEPKETREPKEVKEPKEPKEQKEPKDKGKAPAKAPSKTPIKEEEPKEATPRETPVQEKPEQPSKPVPNDSPPLLRKPLEGELEAGGEIEGLITEEMARHHNLPSTLIGQVVEKRKGPGRPPKDGIMSKRQRSQLIKQAKEIERAKAAGIDPADIPMPSMKPKITKRKDSDAAGGEDGDIRESTENGDGLSGDRKQLKPNKPPRTPSPEPRVEDYTEEQLQRPTANYVVLIHEAISSSSTGQMNLQQIYNYIERKYPWYKFKTTTSGWQSSVRHNLGQHDAFVKGDKEGKGFNWKINQEVSIEKERRKRQVSPPVNHAQRPPYYPPPPNGYPQYPQPPYPYNPGVPPHAMPQAAPRLPPSITNNLPRLPPSMQREASTNTSATTQAAPHPSPYASPWAGGNTAGSPSAQHPPTPYPPPNSQTPPVSAAGQSGQYGVLLPQSASQSYSGPPATASPYGGPYPTAGPSPYGPAPTRPYAPYPPQGQQAPGASPYAPHPQPQPPASQSEDPSPPGRYLPDTDPDLIRQLEAFRKVYLEARKEPGEDRKCDNAIRAFVDPHYQVHTLTKAEVALLNAIQSIEHLAQYMRNKNTASQGSVATSVPQAPSMTSAGTAAAIAADAVANSVAPTTTAQASAPPASADSQTSESQPTTEPHKFTPNMTAVSPAPPPTTAQAQSVPSLPPSHRPSVEPLTPVPGSPAVQSGTPLRRSFVEIPATSDNANAGAEEPQKLETTEGEEVQPAQKVDDDSGPMET
ncbi:hypothetical protein HBI33_154240 [Parastagonospora nodorum]|nr:hypothetical protein HBI33_154240 [Parastagonospora nodorum]